MTEEVLACEVCGQPAIGVASSWLGPFSSAYCRRCASEGAEPYWAIIATASTGMLGSFSGFVPAFQDTVMTTLKILGKSLDEYWRDVEEAIEEYNKYCEEQYNQI